MLRFKNDDGSQFPDWEKKKISDIFSKVKDKNKDGQNQNVITNSAEFGLINQRDFFDKDIAVDGKTENYTVIKTGDFVYNPRKSKQAPYGPFNCYHLEEDGIVSPLYTCLRPKGIVDNEYLQWYFQSGSWYRFIYENGAQNGARHDRVGMTDSLMQEIPIYLPQLAEEQQKIADFLSTIDTVIEKQKKTVSAWEERKKGVMQKLFSQEVRFKADDGSGFPEWEEKKLGEVADVKVGEKPTLVSDNAAYEYVNAGTTNSGYVDSYNCDGDTVTTPSRGQGGIGYVGYQKHEFWLGPLCYKIKSNKDDVLTKFMYYALSFDSKKIVDLKKVGTIPAINRADLIKLYMNFPCLAEQQKIADCLSSLDEVIEKQKATLAAWEELKKGLLQQMFA